MLAYAMHKQGVDLKQVQAVNAGTSESMMAAWRQGQGDYFHEQGPYPQQLEHEQVAHIVASVGEVIGPVAFSSLSATRSGCRGRRPALHAGLSEGAGVGQHCLRSRDCQGGTGVLPEGGSARADETIAYYQQLGCWDPAVTISHATYEAALDVFLHSQLITRRHPYEQVVVAPPD